MTVHASELDHAHITGGESMILDHLVRGLTNAQIGDRCGIASNTVKAHLGHIFAKVGVRNRVELALWAREHWDCCAGK